MPAAWSLAVHHAVGSRRHLPDVACIVSRKAADRRTRMHRGSDRRRGAMTTLAVLSLVYYLTTAGEGGPAWREQDWTANRIIKCVKGETINGWFTVRLRSGTRRFDESTKDKLVTSVCGTVARKLVTLPADQLCIVPIPNSSAA